MNFYAIVGRGSSTAVHALRLDMPAQEDLTIMFERLAEQVFHADHRGFVPGYRAEQGEVVTIAPYTLPSALSRLESLNAAADLPTVTERELEGGPVRGIIGVEWNGAHSHQWVFQRIDSSYVLKREHRRLMFAGGRFVRDERPGIEISDRVDAVLKDSTLFVSNWTRAHAVLDLSAWQREATAAETDTFVNQNVFALAEGFAVPHVADTWVRRKVVSISDNGILERSTPQALRDYAAKFELTIDVKDDKIVLPADKKEFKRVLSLLDEDLLSFEPTNEYWVANSKRPADKGR